MPIEYSSGWLLGRMVLLDTDPKKFYESAPLGLVEEDPDADPWWGSDSEPPPGFETLPWLDEEVGDAERGDPGRS